MAFSGRFAKAKPQAGPPPAAARTSGEESDEVESLDGEDASQRQREEERLRKAREDQQRAQEAAFRRRQAMEEEAARRREAADDARRKAEADEARRKAYEEEKARQATIERSKREAARRATGGGGGFGGGGVSGFGGGNQAFAWKKSAGEDAAGLSFGRGFGGAASGGGAAERSGGRKPSAAGLPSHDDCELGISAMISRTNNGMKEGLSLLGLPHYPLNFIPGQELRLCGHDVREHINEMIHAWMTDEKDEFFEVLVRIRNIVAKPILTEEEMEMMEKQDQWQKVVGPDGKPIFTKREEATNEDDDDEDEVIDVPSGGLGAARAAAAAPAARVEVPSRPAPAASTSEEDYYSLLGVDPNASLHEIRTKFRALVVTEHPEKGGDPKKFQKLNKAYSVLSDQKKRQDYDETVGVGNNAGAKRFVD